MPVFGKSVSARLSNLFILLILLLAAALSLFPMLNTLATSFSDKAAVSSGNITVFPIGLNLSNYQTILEDDQFIQSFIVSVKRVLLGGAIQLALTVLMAFPLSREKKKFAWRNVYMWAIVFAMIFHGGLIPWYMTIKSVGLIDSIWALVLPNAVPVFNVILLMNFMRGLPKELDEAAAMDGAGPWYTLAKIYTPLSMPAIATVTLFSVVGHWNAFFDGLLLIHSSHLMPLQTYINATLLQPVQLDGVDPETMKILMQTSDQGLSAAKVMVSMVPLLLLYPFMQRYFVQGIVLGSVKE